MVTSWKNVRIETGQLQELVEAVALHENETPACSLGRYWRERRGPEMVALVSAKSFLPVGFVGNGWPEKRDQSWVVKEDQYDLSRFFTFADLHTRDAGDSVYQAGRLLTVKAATVVDLGAGYGRLGYPLLMRDVRYFAVDYTPIGLLTAPQFLRQTTKLDIGDWKSKDFSLVRGASVPAWRLDEIPPKTVDVFVSVHSFQEMKRPTIDFYVKWVESRAKRPAFFYSVNIGEPEYVPSDWELQFKQPFPGNRDGDFCEYMWRLT